jgi:hypothetical protein
MTNTKAVGVAYSDPELDGASISNSSFNGSIGSTTASTGAFTSISSTLGVTAGTSSSPISKSSGSINQFYGTATNTTGDVRGIYSKLNFTGAGGSGETLRAFTTVAAAVATGGTVNGAHISMSVNSGGSVSGAGNALRATLGAAASVTPGGTLSVIQVDSDLAATATIGATVSYLRFTNSNTTKVPILFNLDGVDTSTLYIAAGTSAGSAGDAAKCAAQQVVTIRVNGATCYIPVFTQNT